MGRSQLTLRCLPIPHAAQISQHLASSVSGDYFLLGSGYQHRVFLKAASDMRFHVFEGLPWAARPSLRESRPQLEEGHRVLALWSCELTVTVPSPNDLGSLTRLRSLDADVCDTDNESVQVVASSQVTFWYIECMRKFS